MLVLDSQRLEQRRQEKTVERHREQIRKAYENLFSLSVWIDSEENPTDILKRLGTPMTHLELEARLKKLTGELHFEDHPDNWRRKALPGTWLSGSLPLSYTTPKRVAYRVLPDGSRQYLFAYEAGIMPEYSILRRISLDRWDGKTTHIDRKDLGRDLKPGTKRLDLPWREEVRGWRTVLVRLIQCGILTVEQVERTFGSGKTASWAAKTGKRDRSLSPPW